ncbi:hypothetical protein AB4865_10415 [Capnocytophaga sp. ARDL2]|uniref:hypothetical protein n=1 Tax=Capnocytophaga sp. ARDL2 TaxID=3238809 RepID=UPI003556353C
METNAIKKSIINAFYEIVNDLTLSEVEDLQDVLAVREAHLTDDGDYITLEELKKELELAQD